MAPLHSSLGDRVRLCLGFQLLYSTTGGKNGGGATLTPEAAALLAAYEEYCSELNTYAKTLFTEKFEQIL